MEQDKKPLLILTGPTAVGKSELSVRLAKMLNGSIISADSMQVYRGMDIGTAKISKQEMQGIPHELIDVLDPSDDFNVVRFQQMALEAMEKIYSQSRLPILVGGTGFYIQAVLYNIDFTEQDEDASYRHRLEQLAEEQGAEVLHKMLRSVDPESAQKIHPNNIRRTIRALEFFKKSGTPISEHNRRQRAKESPFRFCYFVLTDDREEIYRRIDRRVDQMMEQGLEDEVRRLRDQGLSAENVSMQGLGYKEMLRYLGGDISKEEAVRILKRDTRHFAKRQLTWFRREKDVIFVDKRDFDRDDDKILAYIKSVWEKKIGKQ